MSHKNIINVEERKIDNAQSTGLLHFENKLKHRNKAYCDKMSSFSHSSCWFSSFFSSSHSLRPVFLLSWLGRAVLISAVPWLKLYYSWLICIIKADWSLSSYSHISVSPLYLYHRIDRLSRWLQTWGLWLHVKWTDWNIPVQNEEEFWGTDTCSKCSGDSCWEWNHCRKVGDMRFFDLPISAHMSRQFPPRLWPVRTNSWGLICLSLSQSCFESAIWSLNNNIGVSKPNYGIGDMENGVQGPLRAHFQTRRLPYIPIILSRGLIDNFSAATECHAQMKAPGRLEAGSTCQSARSANESHNEKGVFSRGNHWLTTKPSSWWSLAQFRRSFLSEIVKVFPWFFLWIVQQSDN